MAQMTEQSVRQQDRGLAEKLLALKLLAFDVDGVLSDGGIVCDGAGGEWKRFDVKDCAGIAMARRMGLEIAFLSGRESGATAQRAKELGVALVVQGCRAKGPALLQLSKGLGVTPGETAFMGDDLMDLPAMRVAGVSACPADSHHAVRAFSDYVCAAPGGCGAAREWIETVLAAQGKLDDLLRHFREGEGDA